MAMSSENVTRHRDRFRGALLGLAAGDAVGTTVEFKPRGSFPPVTDTVGGEPFDLNPGEWTDDTSLALCLGQSLLDRHGFDPVDRLRRGGCLKAVNLGDDANTTGAVYEQPTGAFYGYQGIPESWRRRIVKHDLIEEIALGLHAEANRRRA